MNIKQTTMKVIGGLMTVFAVSLFPVSVFADVHSCAGVDTAIISNCTQSNGVWDLLLLAINILTGGVGIVAVGGIVYGSILYASAGDKAEQVKKAVGIITNVVIGIVGYLVMYALLQYLIPGGVF
ncbi:MAG: hypothetical protein ABJA64_01995 [Candidatus Saccharibacteria bacterium]